MNSLQIIEHQNQRVLTTNQLAESFNADTKIINRNFQRNSERYKHGKHYFSLTGDELRVFKGSRQIDDNLKFASVLYLWTEKGAWLHAKSLNTDQAWDAYEMLVDDYYEIKERKIDTTQLSPELQLMNQMVKTMAKNELETKEAKQMAIEAVNTANNISNIVSITNVEWRKKVDVILKKIAQNWTGVEPYRSVRQLSYDRLENRAGCNLSLRLNNRKERAAAQGMTKTYVNRISKLDCIQEEKRLVEIYIQVVKEMAIAQRIDVSDLEEVI